MGADCTGAVAGAAGVAEGAVAGEVDAGAVGAGEEDAAGAALGVPPAAGGAVVGAGEALSCARAGAIISSVARRAGAARRRPVFAAAIAGVAVCRGPIMAGPSGLLKRGAATKPGEAVAQAPIHDFICHVFIRQAPSPHQAPFCARIFALPPIDARPSRSISGHEFPACRL
ncbi:hypothetical protein M673_17120 [Aureimonas sp. AU20]|nr:hypothetical protein M673_17120 [Aureimonas sp. AU20]